jgi:uncharacterized protein YecT (DUF1311 family)
MKGNRKFLLGCAILLGMTISMAYAKDETAESISYRCTNTEPGTNSPAGTTASAVECFNKEYKKWGDILNTNYQKNIDLLSKSLAKYPDSDDPHAHEDHVQVAKEKEALESAQKLWTQYRDANCDMYENRGGTVARILGSRCMVTMTVDRAQELERILKP